MDRPTPEDYQPALNWWRHAWRLLLTLAISATVWAGFAGQQAREMPILFVVDLGLGVVAYALMFFRRRWPIAVAVATNALGAVSGVAAGPATLTAVSMATRRRLTAIVPVAGLALVASTIYTETQPSDQSDPLWLSLTVGLLVLAATMGWGMYIGSRRELIWTLKHRAEHAEAEQELRADQARSTERARIAREMHDVLAHRISQISMHAGALSFRKDLTAEAMRASAAVIQERAHEALTDLRGVLGVLRDDRTGALLNAPLPTYADLPLLVAGARTSGLNVDYSDLIDGSGGELPDVVGRTVYRIVQEGITNAQKHAPGALLNIVVSGSPDEGIDVLLRNPLGFGITRTPGAGLGLVGLAERAVLRGGRLEHRRDGSTFVLHGWIPWAA